MKIAAILPHVEVFGGVRRYLEVGNELTDRGHSFILFHSDGSKPEWLDFKGIVKPAVSIEEEGYDIGICSDYSVLDQFERMKAKKKFFYFIQEAHRKEREVVKKKYFFIANSSGIYNRMQKKYKISCFKAYGGVNLRLFFPLEKKTQRDEVRILCFGRVYKRVKRVRHIIRAVESLYKKYPEIRLLFFDTLVGKEKLDPRSLIHTHVPFDFYMNLPQSKMPWLFSQADIFVSAERRAGWSNTSAEAMACRLAVVCTRSGTRDFAVHKETALVAPFSHPFLLSLQIKRLIVDEKLRLRLAQKGYERIQAFSWVAVVDQLEKAFREA